MKGSDHRPGNTPSTRESLKRMASNTKPINWPYQVVQDFCLSAGFLPKFTNFCKTQGLFEDKSMSSIDPETAITIRSLTSPHLKTILKHTPSHVGDLFFQSSRILQIHDNPFNRSTCTFQRARAACTHRATWRDLFYPLPWRIDRTSTNLPTWMVDSYGKCIQVNIFSPMDPIRFFFLQKDGNFWLILWKSNQRLATKGCESDLSPTPPEKVCGPQKHAF